MKVEELETSQWLCELAYSFPNTHEWMQVVTAALKHLQLPGRTQSKQQ